MIIISTEYINKITFKSIKLIVLLVFFFLPTSTKLIAQSPETIQTKEVKFISEGVQLVGTLYQPQKAQSAVVLVHGSGQTTRMTQFAERLVKDSIAVLTYDKRGVGASGGVYAGPEVGTNNIDAVNLELLSKDAASAVNILNEEYKNLPIGLLGFSQAGWIIPIAANENPLVDFMVLFSCPTITTLEQLRFQFYTNGDTEFWEKHTQEEALDHMYNDPDRYQFTTTDPKVTLNKVSIPGLWIYGELDIQIPAKLCIEHLNSLKAEGKPFEYILFSDLGHSTASTKNTQPVDIAIQWIKQEAQHTMNKSNSKN
ncbi:MAG: alpha/beta hydrolase [Aquimarina sp.]|nr:alpha/beta hydrolase [Aquimarina sp.]